MTEAETIERIYYLERQRDVLKNALKMWHERRMDTHHRRVEHVMAMRVAHPEITIPLELQAERRSIERLMLRAELCDIK